MTDTPVLTRPSQAAERYALDPAWHAERERLDSMTWLYDDTTLRLARQLGLTRGWRCADVGAGTDSIAELLAESVDEAGHVLAVDTDTRFLEPLADATPAGLPVRRPLTETGFSERPCRPPAPGARAPGAWGHPPSRRTR